MIIYLVKLFVTAAIIVVVSEVAKKSSLLGGLVASLPLVSILAMVWLYADTKDAAKVAQLSTSIFWLVLPSLVLFLVLPWLLKGKLNFYLSLGLAMGCTAICYAITLFVLKQFGVKL